MLFRSRPDLIEKCYPIIRGWLGHKAPFDFNNTFEKSASIEMMRVGTPPVIQMSILEKSLDIFRDLDLHKLREESIKLSDLGNLGENKLLLITAVKIMDEYYETKKKVDQKKEELNDLSKKFKELKSLIYDYRDTKESEIEKLNQIGRAHV